MNNSILFLGTSHGDPTLTRFCSSTLYRFENVSILVDTGEPVTALLVRHEIKSSMLNAVLLSHMHTDHIGGLPALITNITKYPSENRTTDFYFPDTEVIEPCRNFMNAVLAFERPDIVRFNTLESDGKIIIENVKITPLANDHMKRKNAPSYGFLFETENIRIIHTGDLSADFHDFPKIDAPVDICVCEATHIHTGLEKFIDEIKN